jgi:hypothetical protein
MKGMIKVMVVWAVIAASCGCVTVRPVPAAGRATSAHDLAAATEEPALVALLAWDW